MRVIHTCVSIDMSNHRTNTSITTIGARRGGIIVTFMCHVARIGPWNELISGPFTYLQDVSLCEEMNLKCKHALVFAKGTFIEHYQNKNQMRKVAKGYYRAYRDRVDSYVSKLLMSVNASLISPPHSFACLHAPLATLIHHFFPFSLCSLPCSN